MRGLLLYNTENKSYYKWTFPHMFTLYTNSNSINNNTLVYFCLNFSYYSLLSKQKECLRTGVSKLIL